MVSHPTRRIRAVAEGRFKLKLKLEGIDIFNHAMEAGGSGEAAAAEVGNPQG